MVLHRMLSVSSTNDTHCTLYIDLCVWICGCACVCVVLFTLLHSFTFYFNFDSFLRFCFILLLHSLIHSFIPSSVQSSFVFKYLYRVNYSWKSRHGCRCLFYNSKIVRESLNKPWQKTFKSYHNFSFLYSHFMHYLRLNASIWLVAFVL